MAHGNHDLAADTEKDIKEKDMVKDRKQDRHKRIKCEEDGCGKEIRSDKMKQHQNSHRF